LINADVHQVRQKEEGKRRKFFVETAFAIVQRVLDTLDEYLNSGESSNICKQEEQNWCNNVSLNCGFTLP
jgi:hypothetical protein